VEEERCVEIKKEPLPADRERFFFSYFASGLRQRRGAVDAVALPSALFMLRE
jgi:hypothetical protein